MGRTMLLTRAGFPELWVASGEAMVVKKILTYRLMRQSGFTMIELMMIMFVIAALIALALPVYKAYANRPTINAAQQDLIRMATALETNSYEKKLALPDVGSYVAVPASPTARTSGTTATDFAGWAPTQGAFFTYEYGSWPNLLVPYFIVRATSVDANVLPTTCWMAITRSPSNVTRTADASCGFTKW